MVVVAYLPLLLFPVLPRRSLPPPASLWVDGDFQTIPSLTWPCETDTFTRRARTANGSGAATVNTTTALCQHHGGKKGTRLQVLRTTRRFSDFPGAVDVVARLRQAGSLPHRVCDVAELDWSLPLRRGAVAILRGHIGGNDSAVDFTPFSVTLGDNATASSARAHVNFSSVGGLPSGAYMPVFSLSLPGIGRTAAAGGFVWSLGWSGNWMQTFSVTDGALRIRIASGSSSSTGARFCPVMQPGESFQLARIVLLPWSTPTQQHNVLRQFLRRHVVPLGKDNRPGGLLLSANDFDRFSGGRDATHNLWLASEAARSGLDALWVDALWFAPAFPLSGNWQLPLKLTEDRRRFPAGLRPVFDAARQEELMSILWTEPERVSTCAPGHTGCAYIEREFPTWILHASIAVETSRRNHNSALLNLGNEDARRYITDFLSAAVEHYALDVLRFDFNIQPAQYWMANDPPNRSGVTERLYLQGLATMWDGAAAVASFLTAVLTQFHLCGVCSCHGINIETPRPRPELRARHPALLLDSCEHINRPAAQLTPTLALTQLTRTPLDDDRYAQARRVGGG
jgi:alpha-galactosidase